MSQPAMLNIPSASHGAYLPWSSLDSFTIAQATAIGHLLREEEICTHISRCREDRRIRITTLFHVRILEHAV